ncbi:hypothetical protein E1297_00570 [Roseibium sp. RKSG952]|nr:hypothetical protein [Roseibium sp. RKSG952]
MAFAVLFVDCTTFSAGLSGNTVKNSGVDLDASLKERFPALLDHAALQGPVFQDGEQSQA